MHNRIARYSATLAGTLLALGALGATTASAEIALNTNNEVGYQAGNNAWRFRFIQTKFTVPVNACYDSFEGAGVELNGTTDNVALGVSCFDGTVYAGYRFGYSGTASPGSFTHVTTVSADDTILAQIYYDPENNQVFLYEYDLTAGRRHTAGRPGASTWRSGRSGYLHFIFAYEPFSAANNASLRRHLGYLPGCPGIRA